MEKHICPVCKKVFYKKVYKKCQNNDKSNLITLCLKCHLRRHYGTK